MTKQLTIGSKVPHFQIKDLKGITYTERDLLGKPCAIIFLPQKIDDISLKLLHSLRDNLEVFMKAESLIIVITPFSIKDNVSLIKNHRLNFPVMGDESKEIYKIFDIIGQNDLIETSIIFDTDGYICWIEKPIKHESHLKKVLKVLKEHAPKHVPISDIFDENEKLQKKDETK